MEKTEQSDSGGMVRWRHAAVKPPGQAKPDDEIVDLVFRHARELVKDSSDPKDEIIKRAFWTYTRAEDVLLADWTSIHLDVIAYDRGLKRLGASFYEL